MYIRLYAWPVRFDWDARKSDRNLADRGFDFEFAARIFEGRTLEREDTRYDYTDRVEEVARSPDASSRPV